MPDTALLRNFAAGVVTAMRPDEIPDAASPRAWNNALISVGGDHAIPAKRRGALIQNTAPITGRPAIIGQVAFNRRSGGTLTQHHLLVSNNGRLDRLQAGAITNIGTPFTSGDLYPSFVVANNLCFMVNGTDAKKYDGTSVTNFGITRPSAAPTAVDSGVAGNPSGTYEFAISYGNSSTGTESSLSDSVSVTVTAKKITVGWATPTDPQVDQVFLYVRKTSLTSVFFRLTAGVTPGVTNGAFGILADPITVDCTDTQLNALTVLAPDIAENNPPPSGLKALAWHKSRMFGIDNTTVYFSQAGQPENWDPDYRENVNLDDGQILTGIFSAFDSLILFKSNAMYALVGDDPTQWSITQLDPVIGCTAQRSLKFANGFLYWWSERGPVRWSGSGKPELIGEALLAPTVGPDNLNYARLDMVVTEIDTARQHVLFAVPTNGSTRNDIILPFNYKTGGWDSDRWDPFDIASMCVADDAAGQPWVYMANYAGRVFQWWNADTDGARQVDGLGGPAFTLQGTPTAVTLNTLTDSGANFDTTDDGFKDLFVYVEDAQGSRERRRITANTGTMLVLNSDLTIVPTKYTIACPDWQFDTKWLDLGAPFNRKHWLFLLVQAMSNTGAADIEVDVFTNWDAITKVKHYTLTAYGGGDLWDAGLWDLARMGAEESATSGRRRVGKVSRVIRFRIRNQTPTIQAALLKIQISGQLQTVKN